MWERIRERNYRLRKKNDSSGPSELLGNESLKRLQKVKNLNYESEMIMNEDQSRTTEVYTPYQPSMLLIN